MVILPSFPWKISQSKKPKGPQYVWNLITPAPQEKFQNHAKKSCIRETPTLSTDVDSWTDSNLRRLRDLSKKTQFFLRGLRKKKKRKKREKPRGRRGWLTNERPGSVNVIRGQMKDLKNNERLLCSPRTSFAPLGLKAQTHKHTHGHGDS